MHTHLGAYSSDIYLVFFAIRDLLKHLSKSHVGLRIVLDQNLEVAYNGMKLGGVECLWKVVCIQDKSQSRTRVANATGEPVR